jgi:hypothetical protein
MNGKKCFVLIYVDDMVVASEDEQVIKFVFSSIQKHFEIVDLGDISHFLEMGVERDQNGDFFNNQECYINSIVESSGLADAKVSKFPLDTGYEKIEDSKKLGDNKLYQKLIGQLLYVAVNSRPDISASVSILSQKISCPTKTDLNELKRVVRYLKGTSNMKLCISGKEDGLHGFSDANWAESRNDRKSNSGYLFKYNGGTVSWACRKQQSVALSTCEAEFYALAETCKEFLWLKNLLKDFGYEQLEPYVIEVDNQSCIKIVEGQKFSNRTKHIDTRFHFVKELQDKNVVKLKYCPTENNVADLLTKPLGSVKLSNLRKMAGLFCKK